jgi:hypothetical protein
MTDRWRPGRKAGRTVYNHRGHGPDGTLIGLMDTPELARKACDAVNTVATRASQSPERHARPEGDTGDGHEPPSPTAALSAPTMRAEDVPDEWVMLAVRDAKPGCQDDARFYLAAVIPAIEQARDTHHLTRLDQVIEDVRDSEGVTLEQDRLLVSHLKGLMEARRIVAGEGR